MRMTTFAVTVLLLFAAGTGFAHPGPAIIFIVVIVIARCLGSSLQQHIANPPARPVAASGCRYCHVELGELHEPGCPLRHEPPRQAKHSNRR